MKKLEFSKNIEVKYNVDIMVAGGGPAGTAAAVMAARQGMSVLLVEAGNCLGGLGTAGMVPCFMQFTDGENFLADGFGREIVGKIREYGGENGGSIHGGYSIKAEILKRIYDDILTESNVQFLFGTNFLDTITHDGTVQYAVCTAKSGMFAIAAKIYIDATGDGDLCVASSAPFEKGDSNGNMMGGTLCSLWTGVNWDNVKPPDSRNLGKAFDDNVFTIHDLHLPGMWKISDKVAGGNVGHIFGVDGTDETSLTKALIFGRRSLVEYQKYYKEYLSGYEDLELIATGSILGIRETRRIIGDYVLTLGDFMKRAHFDDEIGRYAYPIDIHPSDASVNGFEKFKQEFYDSHYKKGESYGIPYRVLIPQNLKNVLVAGRCVSSDRAIQASIRVMPGCYITGQAAGIAASIAVNNNTDTRGFNVKKLQRKLQDAGAFLPNTK
ncbi:hypothetical protein ES703_49745 [subsurface metagenome]